MNALIVVNRDVLRRNYLAGLISDTIKPLTTTGLDRGVDISYGMIDDEVLHNAPFDLVLYHCGGTNTEYNSFIKTYRALSEQRDWTDPIIILFSGDPTAVARARAKFPDDSSIYAISQRQLEANLRRLLETWTQANIVGDTTHSSRALFGEILAGENETEFILQLLSALLPFGLIWEAEGPVDERKGFKQAAKSLSLDSFIGLERTIAERLIEFSEDKNSCKRTLEERMRGVTILNNLLSSASHDPRCTRIWTSLETGDVTPPKNLEEALKLLADSATLNQWNARLTALRDILFNSI